MEKMKSITNTVTALILCVIIIISSIIVGTSLKENTKIITYISLIVFFVYMFFYKFILKKKFKDIYKNINKIDICIIMLCLTSLIPLIFKTYISWTDTINICIRYITLLIIYLLSKILMLQNEKYKSFFINSLIISGIISVVIGIDNMILGFFTEKLELLGVPKEFNFENRMIGNFGYSNTFAISMLIPLFLSLHRYLKSNNKFKVLYIIISFLFTSCFILTYSRASYIILILAFIMFFILLRNKEKNINLLNIILVIGLFALLYSKIFADYYTTNIFIIISLLIIFSIISAILITLLNKCKFLKQIKLKKYLKILIFLIFLILVVILIGLKLTKPLRIYDSISDDEMLRYKIINIENNKNYHFEFDIDSLSKEDSYIYLIEIAQKDIYDETLGFEYLRFGTFKGKKEVTIIPEDNTYSFYIVFRTLDSNYNIYLNVNELKINNEEYPLNYAYLPVKFINRINSTDIESLIRHGRLAFYKDSLKIIKKNVLTGAGGNTWKYSYEEIKSYDYETIHVHSFPLQLFLNFGLLSIITYILLVILIFIRIKKINKEDYGVFMAIIVIVLHSTIDFDLSFMNMLIYMFILISILSISKKNTKFVLRVKSNSDD